MLGAVRERLGVPLDAQEEGPRRVLDRLDRPVGGASADAQARAERVDGLVVEGVDLERVAGAGDGGQQRAGRDVDALGGRVRDLGLAVAVDVLAQRPAARDVQRLGAAADAEHRQARGVGGAGDGELEGVVRGVRGAELGGALDRAVDDRVEVGAAGQADPVEARDERRDRLERDGREDDRDRPGGVDRLRVGGAEHELVVRRQTSAAQRGQGAGAQLGGGDADEGTHSPVLLGSLRGLLYVQGAKPRRPAFATLSNRNG